ncbi:heterokaryon incompatibility protein-domain-containing protein [Hypoxylon cercidicola]|nr:heterokaryon incompatibility protein-domain-containing protein [Hypoxylon cercidicola]
MKNILRCLRYADKPRIIWIDALCINQNDDVEKGPQVARMGDIYPSAHRISIWLGREENDSTRALNSMLWIGSKVTVDWVRFTVALRPECVEPSFQDIDKGIPLRPEDTEAIFHLLSRRWFERLWIRQEVLPAKTTAVVQCGLYQIPWPPFRRALACIYQKPRTWTPFDDKLNKRLLSLRGHIIQSSIVPLAYVRASFGQSDCKDPRDRIYALLEFLPEKDRAVVSSPDYTKDVEVIFRDIVWRHIKHYGSLDLLSQCQINSKLATDISWTPDWTKKEFIYGRSYWRGFASSQFGEMCTISEDGRVLRTPGASITTVEDLKDISTIDGNHPNEQVQETLRMLVPNDKLNKRYVTGVSMLEAFIRTFVVNALSENQEPWSGFDPALEEAQEIILNALKVMRAMLGDRKLMRGTDGYIGTVPQPTQNGDEVCVLLGCHTPMVLRRVKDDIFRIVGECYVLGISEGEALLGPLPDGTRRLFASDPKSGVQSYFLNSRTGHTGLMDPRLQKSFPGLEDFPERLGEDPNAKIQLTPEQLHSIFPQMREFDII